MKLKKVLKALFFHKEEPVELDLTAAEIREGKAFLHPKNEKGVTYLVRSDHIEISLSKGFSLSPEHIVKIEPKDKQEKTKAEAKRNPPQKHLPRPYPTMNLISTRNVNSLCLFIRMSTIP